jgi:hypothetical protein
VLNSGLGVSVPVSFLKTINPPICELSQLKWKETAKIIERTRLRDNEEGTKNSKYVVMLNVTLILSASG